MILIPKLESLIKEIRNDFNKLMILISKFSSFRDSNTGKLSTDGSHSAQKVKLCQSLVTFLPGVLHNLGSTINRVREIINLVLTKGVQLKDTKDSKESKEKDSKEMKNLSAFERAMRFGLKSHLNLILLALSTIHSSKELLESIEKHMMRIFVFG